MWQGERKKGTGNLVTSWRTSPDGRKSRRILLASQHDWCTPYVYVIIHTCTCRCHGCMLLKARAMHARTHTAVHKCLIVRAFNSMLKAGTRMHTHTHTHTHTQAHRHTAVHKCLTIHRKYSLTRTRMPTYGHRNSHGHAQIYLRPCFGYTRDQPLLALSLSRRHRTDRQIDTHTHATNH